jgi:hypothetical protein
MLCGRRWLIVMVQADDPDLVWATGEFQGGSLDPWGGVRTFFIPRSSFSDPIELTGGIRRLLSSHK